MHIVLFPIIRYYISIKLGYFNSVMQYVSDVHFLYSYQLTIVEV